MKSPCPCCKKFAAYSTPPITRRSKCDACYLKDMAPVEQKIFMHEEQEVLTTMHGTGGGERVMRSSKPQS